METGRGVNLGGGAIMLGVAGLLLAGIAYFQSRLTAGLQPAPGPRPTAGEWFRRARRARPTWTYWTSAVAGISCW